MDAASDAVMVEMLAGAADRSTASATWSSCYFPDSEPGHTLKGPFALGFVLPETPPKIVTSARAPRTDADYTIVSKLGEGGMGIVFEARQNHLSRRVALKAIRPEKAGDSMARNSFFYEAIVTAGMEHPGIVPILEFGRSQDGRDFYTMKKATGVPWSKVIRERTLEENLALFERVADVAAYAHAQGVIHRDIKPANVLLGDFGEVWLADWGVAVARNSDGDYRHAHPGGTPRYMAPEMAQCDTALIGPASDLYLLGALLFEILAGHPPHSGDTVPATLENAAGNIIADSGAIPGGSLLDVARKAMATHPGHRYRTVQDMQAAIRQAVREGNSRAILERADRHLSQARQSGEYDMYRQAIAEFDSALEMYPDGTEAKNGRLKALLAYAREALKREEFDLARSIIGPEAGVNGKAASLVAEIEAKQAATKQFRRRRRIVNTVLGILVLGLLSVGTYLAYYRYDYAADMLRFEKDSVQSRVSQIHRSLRSMYFGAHSGKIWAEGRRDQELADLCARLGFLVNECQGEAGETQWQTPSAMKHLHALLRENVPEMEEIMWKLAERMEEEKGEDVKRSFQRLSFAFGGLTRVLEDFMPWLDKE